MPTPQYHRASTRRRRRGNRSQTASDLNTRSARIAHPEDEDCALLHPAPDEPDKVRDEPIPALLTRRPRRR
jgi:hypothetical protein